MKLKFVATAACLALATASAFANDQITSKVTIPDGQPVPLIVNNGVPSGTIQLWYTVIGSSIPCGTSPFAQFTLNLQDAGGKGVAPTYGVNLNLAQSGSGTPVQLSPDPSSFNVSDATWFGSSTVTVYVNCANLEAASDGQDIVGNLNESASDSHLDTITSVQVHIKLVIPSATACLQLYSFETDDTGALLDTVSLVEKTKSGTTTITSSNPGSIWADGLVVNTCGTTENFDLSVGLNGSWLTQPYNVPGNAVFTYTEDGELDPSTISITGGTGQGQALCTQDATLASGKSYLETVHSQINSGIAVPTSSAFTFSSTLSTATTAPTTCGSGSLLPSSLVSPTNPVSSTLNYTITNP